MWLMAKQRDPLVKAAAQEKADGLGLLAAFSAGETVCVPPLSFSSFQILDLIETAIIILNPEGKVLVANRFACHLLGTCEADIVGQNWFTRYVPENKREAAWKLFRSVVAGEIAPIEYFEHPVCTERGEIRWIGWRNSLLRDEAGRITAWVAMGEDLTEQVRATKALQQSEAQIRTIFENVPVGIFRLAPDGDFLAANPALARMLGYSLPQDVLALRAQQLYVRPEQYQHLLTAVEKYGEIRNFEVHLRRRNGEEIVVLQNIRLVKGQNHETLYYEGSLTDITEQKRTEEVLQRRIAALEALYQSGMYLNMQFEPRQIAQHVISILQDKLSWHHIAIRGYDPQSDSLKVLALSVEGLSAAEIAEEEKRLNAIVTDASRGLSGWVIRHGETVRSNHLQVDPRYVESYAGIRSGLYVPLKIGERVIGSIAVESSEADAFDEADEQFLQTLAFQLAVSLENARLFRESQKRAGDLAALYETAQAVIAHHELDRVLQVIVERSSQLVGAPLCAIYLYDEKTDDLLLAVQTGLPKKDELRARIGDELVRNVAHSRQAIVIEDDPTWQQRAATDGELPLRAIAGVPLLYNGNLVGVLVAAETDTIGRKFTEDQVHLLSLLANTAASAIYTARLIRQLEAQIDHLSALHEIDTAIAATTDLRMSLRVALEHAIRLLKVDAACVFTFNPATLALTYVTSIGIPESFGFRKTLQIGDGLVGKAILQGKIIRSEDPREFGGMFSNRQDFRAYMAVPLKLKGRVNGVLEIYQRELFAPDTEWLDLLSILTGQIALAIEHAQLLEQLERANAELSVAYDATIEGWSRALDLRDHETEGHTQRVTELTLRLARAMNIPESQLVHIYRGALLHDIGKIGVPDSILRKEGPLTEQEWEIMREHPRLAYELMSPIVYLRPALDIPYCHHEKWDGSGYPRGLKGEEIPLAARLFAVADVFDALTSDRPYRKAWSVEQALQYIAEQAGKHFDPNVAGIFLAFMSKDFKQGGSSVKY